MESAYSPKKKRGRSVYCTSDVCAGLKEIWESANSCCGELLYPIIKEYVSIFERDKMWKHSDLATGKLLSMSLATVKRKVNGWQSERGRKPNSSQKRSVKKCLDNRHRFSIIELMRDWVTKTSQ